MLFKKIISFIEGNPPEDQNYFLKNYKKAGYSSPESFQRACRKCDLGTVQKITEFLGNETIATDIQGAPPYEVVNDHYIIETKRGTISMPVELIDQLFFEFSAKGENLSQKEILNKHNLQPWTWNAIKNRLSLYKTSNIISPHTWDNTPHGERESVLFEKMEQLNDNEGRLVVKTYEAARLKKIKRQIENYELNRIKWEDLICEINDKRITKELTVRKTNADKIEHLVVAIADIHAGANSTGLQNTEDTTTEILKERIKAAVQRINEMQAANVHIILGGDYIESFTGLNHDNVWQSMEAYGAEAFWQAIDLITDLSNGIHNLASIKGVPGNHDRGDKSKAVDPTGQIGLIILQYLKRHLPVPVEIDPHLLSVEIDGIGYLIEHGDKRTARMKGADKVFQFGNNSIYNVILSFHLHTFKVIEDNSNYIRLCGPSIFAGNRYSEELGFSSNPGFLIFWRKNKRAEMQRVSIS